MAKTKKKTEKKGQKLKSKLSKIKGLIAMNPSHPGSLTPQQITKEDGTKTKKYYSWQGSYKGKKYCYRIPDNEVDALKKVIDAAKSATKLEDRKNTTILNSYKKALRKIMDDNAKIRKENGEEALKAAKKSEK